MTEFRVDWMLLFLCLLIAGVFLSLLAPVPKEPRPGSPRTHDTRNRRRL